jgi:hypothetical protein
MRATKITKYFQVEQTDPLFFFPEKSSSSPPIQPASLVTPTPPSPVSYDLSTISIHFVTIYQPSNQTIWYGLIFPNYHRYDIFSTIEKCENPIFAELKALLQALQYVVYHPNLFQKINKYKLLFSTNSQFIPSITKPDQTVHQYSSIYFKIQSLLKCIKQFHIEYSENIKESFDRLKNQYHL